ncbi:dephospho-CoA kinase [Zooshikella ganghwensis]|uniref:Dephospho-CoA kinase n=1 Tax=Zooshikella ganghwensis TaxID=202772 RepID=A0A4P9VSR7_9GAMM|nr:dephospho-CoA kinase [Zooshikella ganghwensis]
MFIVGLTGGIGSGKSAATDFFKRQGIHIEDADQVSRALVEKDSPVLSQIVEHFGSAILNIDSSLNRRKLREIIFQDKQERQWLEQLLHPLINQKMLDNLHSASSPYAIMVSPLLLETGQQKLVDRVLVIDADESAQIERVCERDHHAPNQVKAIIATQLPRNKRLAMADDIIDNSGNLEQLYTKLASLHQTYLSKVKP